MTDDLFKDLESQADATSEKWPAWKPAEHGNTLRGHVRAIAYPYVPAASEHRWVMTVEDEDGTMLSVWLSSQLLLRQVFDAAPALNSAIVLKFKGKKPTKDGTREYNDYSFAAAEGDISWWLDTQREALAKDQLMEGGDNAGGGQPVRVAPTQFGPDEAPF